MEETINWLDSGIVCAARQERRKEGMPPGMFGSLKEKKRRNQGRNQHREKSARKNGDKGFLRPKIRKQKRMRPPRGNP